MEIYKGRKDIFLQKTRARNFPSQKGAVSKRDFLYRVHFYSKLLILLNILVMNIAYKVSHYNYTHRTLKKMRHYRKKNVTNKNVVWFLFLKYLRCVTKLIFLFVST